MYYYVSDVDEGKIEYGILTDNRVQYTISEDLKAIDAEMKFR